MAGSKKGSWVYIMQESNWKSNTDSAIQAGPFQITPWEVINLDPLTVYLIYNCYYMREICKNAENFAATSRGQNLHPVSGLGNNVYGYDLNTGDTKPKSRQDYRRSASCPESWKITHTCPETDQRKPMRQDGEWFTTLLEPGTTDNGLMDLRDPITNNVLRHSRIRYTCDEFPPATWYVLMLSEYCESRADVFLRVEGGNGYSANSPANTRCAALSCLADLDPSTVKAEQNCGLSSVPFPPGAWKKWRAASLTSWAYRAGTFPRSFA
jgi:hypothetical protein